MSNLSHTVLALSLLLSPSISLLDASTPDNPVAPKQSEASLQNPLPDQTKTIPVAPSQPSISMKKFSPFTGKVMKNNVRVRLQSAYDGFVVREVNRDDLVVVVGETEDFYAIQAPSDLHAYIFRTFVLDNVVEGNHVNVRLKPELDAPVMGQLNSGDKVDGVIAPTNNKWLEINLPDNAHFYIAKEFIEKAGDANFKAQLEKKREKAYHLLQTTDAVSELEMKKPFEQINIEGIKTNYQHVMLDYPEFPELNAKAKEALNTLQEAYLAKKLAFLENQSNSSIKTLEVNKKLSAELQAQKNKVHTLEQQLEKNKQSPSFTPSSSVSINNKPSQIPLNMSNWIPVEDNLFQTWSQQTGNQNPKDFYDQQIQQGFVLKGVIDSYTRPVKNKPGDYMLVSATSQLPIAFLYSTHINLQDYMGHEVAVVVSPRDNNHFAFPAYFVLSVE